MSAKAATFNLTGDYAIKQGSNFKLSLVVYRSTGVVWDLSTPGTTIAAKLRRKFSDAASLVDFTTTITDGPNGAFDITLTAVQTAALTVSATAQNPDTRDVSLGSWDCELTESGLIDRIIQGTADMSQEATK